MLGNHRAAGATACTHHLRWRSPYLANFASTGAEVSCSGKTNTVFLLRWALGILGVLTDRAGEVVSRTDLIAAVCPGTAVEDSNLNVQIAALRRVLDDVRTGRGCIQTIPGHG